jgi:hypothetical protein
MDICLKILKNTISHDDIVKLTNIIKNRYLQNIANRFLFNPTDIINSDLYQKCLNTRLYSNNPVGCLDTHHLLSNKSYNRKLELNSKSNYSYNNYTILKIPLDDTLPLKSMVKIVLNNILKSKTIFLNVRPIFKKDCIITDGLYSHTTKIG